MADSLGRSCLRYMANLRERGSLHKKERGLIVVQLNDIISLVVGLWAVKASQQSSTDKYSFGVSYSLLC